MGNMTVEDAVVPTGSTRIDELRTHWRIILGIILGLSAGVTSTLGYSHGALIAPLEAEFGWSRAYLSLGITAFGFALLFTGARWGALADRFGARRVSILSLLLYALCLLSTPILIRIMPFWLVYFVTSILGGGASAVTLTKPINDNFASARGLAIGFAFAGIGLGAFWVPLATLWLINLGGWAYAYYGMGVMALLVTPVLWVLLGPTRRPAGSTMPLPARNPVGLTLKEATATSEFWLLIAIGTALTLGIVGITTHLIPLMRSLGASPEYAVAVASILGLSSMAARLLVGLALDRTRGPVIAVIVPLVATAGILLLVPGTLLAPIAVILIGLAFGSEVDMVAYFTSRYFGRKEFGAIYGWMFGTFAIAGGCAAYISGALYDHFGNYHVAMFVCLVLTGVAALLASRLNAYRYAAGDH
ncbi:MFS transporter [Sphingobium sp. WCS2017Hpa-17]|uniref:MFS transporter n=1 Tax=Sphingobium sp. WCS2017Hpa-17 TaxID=3073638 RepID=UPI00288B685E|nr:MFS transporter [Sphingobium sp. WCS2017Hpa-17]